MACIPYGILNSRRPPLRACPPLILHQPIRRGCAQTNRPVSQPDPVILKPRAAGCAKANRLVSQPDPKLNSGSSVIATPKSIRQLTPRALTQPTKLAVFDFDCTLSQHHVFSLLSGNADATLNWSLPPPYASTEKGQLSRLRELDIDPQWGPGVFAMKAFGGKHRVAELRKVLETLQDADVECVIVSRGLVGPIRKCLEQVGLLRFFGRVIGNRGCALGEMDYDQNIPHRENEAEEHLLGRPEDDLGGFTELKSEQIRRFMKERKLTFNQVSFIDDQYEEIKSTRHICRTILVASGIGELETEFQVLVQEILNRPHSSEIASTEAGSPYASSCSEETCDDWRPMTLDRQSASCRPFPTTARHRSSALASQPCTLASLRSLPIAALNPEKQHMRRYSCRIFNQPSAIKTNREGV